MFRYQRSPATGLLKSLKVWGLLGKTNEFEKTKKKYIYLHIFIGTNLIISMQIVPKNITEIVPWIFVRFRMVSSAANLNHTYSRVNIHTSAATVSHDITTLTTWAEFGRTNTTGIVTPSFKCWRFFKMQWNHNYVTATGISDFQELCLLNLLCVFTYRF